ncbi:Hypothetical predicted protein [Cloeon dipterum]|uniref:Shavenoid isoform B-like N-terminal domain-containing protein n=1 Tax=Cloeon dipterum TaxID=197152 RepID=A0A8S1CET5_9INSE|nr:Hypothetical predicted protein [Cloeon dipterum]
MLSSLNLIAALLILVGGDPVASSTVYRAAGVTRHSDGDTFYLKKDGVAVACTNTLCADSRAVPSPASTPGARKKDDPPCVCKCPDHSPTFREDLHVCVDDFHECSLATFKNSQKKQKIPFVFLPMKGQIIHPSSDIVFNADVGEDPICVVSSAQFLTRSSWLELRNTSDTEPPLRLFRDQRHTFLQWLGEQDLRVGMEGRILLARLMCKDPSGLHHSSPTDDGQGVITHTFSTPCIAFRVAGSQGAREVSFTSDYSLAGTGGGLLHGLMSHENSNTGLGTLEYLAVGLCIVLLCLVYATSVIVYVHVRRIRRKKKRSRNESGDDSDSERGHGGYSRRTEMNLMSEGVVKNNPLLMSPGSENFTKLPSLFHKAARSIRLPRGDLPVAMEHEAESSAEEDQSQNSPKSEHSSQRGNDNNSASPVLSKTSEIKVQIHPESSSSNEPGSSSSGDENQHSPELQTSGIYTLTLQPPTESGSLERHPGESVSIVETLDEENSKEGRDFSFLGRHTFNSTSLGLPDSEAGCSGNCNASSSHSGPLLGTVMGRRKLYFNPAYFDPEMLQSPPQAAIEFLQKLREVVAMSKMKIAAKRYNPSLIGIPEEGDSIVSSRTSQSVNGYTKQENWQIDQAPATEGAVSSSLLPTLDVCGSKQQTIRRWLEDLDSGEPVEDQELPEKASDQLPPVVKTPSLEAPKKPRRANGKAPQPKKLMDAVIKELVRERGLLGEDIPSSETTTSGEKSLESIQNEAEENPYELIAVNQSNLSNAAVDDQQHKRPPLMMFCLPELLAKTSGYNLVSEVYVNDDYSCSSNQSSSSNSTINRHTIKHRPPKNSLGTPSDTSSPSSSVSENLEAGPDADHYPGSLTIKLPEAAPHEYVERREEDQFEPDTLDRARKNTKPQLSNNILCADSLERPLKIQLKSSGSFFADAMNEQHSWGPLDVWSCSEAKKRKGPNSISDLRSNNIAFVTNLNKAQGPGFGSLREIFEAKRQMQLKSQFDNLLAGPPGELQAKQRVARSMITPNELRIRAQGMEQASIDDIRQMMWSTTPDVTPKPKPKPKRQRTADVSACPPTPPPSVPPPPATIPPSLPPKKKSIDHGHNPPLPPREPAKSVPPPSLPPKNLRGCRSPPQSKIQKPQQQLPNLITSHSALHRASAESEEEDYKHKKEGIRGRSASGLANDAFSKWKKNKWEQETSIKMPNRPGDSGYLSSDSNNSLKRVANEMRDQSSETDEDESLCEGGSESGAESIGTDSIFYKASPHDSSRNSGEKGRDMNVLLPHAKKKVPPPPPKRVNSKLNTIVLRNNNLIKSNLNAKYGL